MTVFASLLHTHTIGMHACNHVCMQVYVVLLHVGVSVKMRHIRNGKELPPIDSNLHYDFNFQQSSVIPSIKVLPVSTLLCESAVRGR